MPVKWLCWIAGHAWMDDYSAFGLWRHCARCGATTRLI